MSGPTIAGRLVLLALSVIALSGCLHRQRWASVYQDAYVQRLAGLEVPADADIRTASVEEDDRLAEPTARVWDSFLALASRSCSLLGVRDDPGEGHRALITAYHGVPGFDALVDRWLAVSIQPAADQGTRVSIALVSPETLRVASLDSDPAAFHPGAAASRSLGLAASADLLLAINQSFAEPAYLRRLGVDLPVRPRGPGSAPTVESDPQADLRAERHGNYTSARSRRERFLLDYPELTRRANDIAHRLAVAAGHPGSTIKVYFVADRELAPHIEANGDLFVTTGTLDAVANLDELAGIMAHEMAHLYLHHGPLRQDRVRGAWITIGAMTGAVSIAALVYGIYLPSVPTSTTTEKQLIQAPSLASIALVSVAVTYGAPLVGEMLGLGLAKAEVHLFSQAEELAADDYGTELLWRAGYDYRGLLSLLERTGNHLSTAQ